MKAIDLVGKKFGRLQVLNRDTSIRDRVAFICICDCGNIKSVYANNLKRKIRPTRSCGCLMKEITSAAITKFPGKRGLNAIYCIYRAGAKVRGLSFHLTHEEFEEITQKNCIYCGAVPSNMSALKTGTQSKFIYNGIDRKDNDIGYMYENCVPCCEICNKMKKVKTIDDFALHISKIYHHFVLIHNPLITL